MGRPLLMLSLVVCAISACGRQTFPGDPADGSVTPGPNDSPSATPTAVAIDHTDTGFGDLGRVHAAFSGNSHASRAAVGANDTIVVAGSSDDDSALARYTSAGDLDSSFASVGWERFDISNKVSYDWSEGVAVLPNGKTLVAGAVHANGHDYAKLSRFNTNGLRDATFGSAGVLTMDFGFADSDATTVIVAGDGSSFVGIDASTSSQHAWVIAKLTPAGVLDASYGTSGRAVIGLDPLYQQAELDEICLVPGGGLVLAGTMHDDTMLVKLNASGKLDTSFGGGNGYVNRGSGTQVSLWSITSLANGDLIVSGASVSPVDGSFDLFALETTSTGAIETSFGVNGVVIEDLGSDMEWGTRVLEESDGSLSIGATSTGMGIVRLSATGAPDPAWGVKGFNRSSASTASDYAEDVVRLSSGRLVVVGSNLDQPDTFVLAGFN